MEKFAKIVQIIVQNNLLIIFFSLSLSMVLTLLLAPPHEAAFNYCKVGLACNVLFLSWTVLTPSLSLLLALGNQVGEWFAKA